MKRDRGEEKIEKEGGRREGEGGREGEREREREREEGEGEIEVEGGREGLLGCGGIWEDVVHYF